jgi:hypothetical protein
MKPSCHSQGDKNSTISSIRPCLNDQNSYEEENWARQDPVNGNARKQASLEPETDVSSILCIRRDERKIRMADVVEDINTNIVEDNESNWISMAKIDHRTEQPNARIIQKVHSNAMTENALIKEKCLTPGVETDSIVQNQSSSASAPDTYNDNLSQPVQTGMQLSIDAALEDGNVKILKGFESAMIPEYAMNHIDESAASLIPLKLSESLADLKWHEANDIHKDFETQEIQNQEIDICENQVINDFIPSKTLKGDKNASNSADCEKDIGDKVDFCHQSVETADYNSFECMASVRKMQEDHYNDIGQLNELSPTKRPQQTAESTSQIPMNEVVDKNLFSNQQYLLEMQKHFEKRQRVHVERETKGKKVLAMLSSGERKLDQLNSEDIDAVTCALGQRILQKKKSEKLLHLQKLLTTRHPSASPAVDLDLAPMKIANNSKSISAIELVHAKYGTKNIAEMLAARIVNCPIESDDFCTRFQIISALALTESSFQKPSRLNRNVYDVSVDPKINHQKLQENMDEVAALIEKAMAPMHEGFSCLESITKFKESRSLFQKKSEGAIKRNRSSENTSRFLVSEKFSKSLENCSTLCSRSGRQKKPPSSWW